MSGSRKRKPHRCIQHQKVVARGRCSRCGSWICNDCALLYRGQFYCAEKCAPGQASTIQIPTVDEAVPVGEPGSDTARTSWSKIVAGSALTLSLCGIVFALWAIREIAGLRDENRFLKEKRLELVSLVRKNNAEIAQLRSSSAAQPEADQNAVSLTTPTTPRPQTYSSEPPSPPDLAPEGIPLSLDNGSTNLPLVALTFDGGSHANAADQILDTLRSRNVRATMFVTGHFIRRFPHVVKRIASEGHELGNHLMDHPHLTSWETDHAHTTLPTVTELTLAGQLVRNQDLLNQTLGLTFAPIWRAPYGEKNRTICRWALRAGYLHVGWRQGRTWRHSLDSNDWIPNEETAGYKSPREVIDKILGMADTKPYGINGGIVLMHLGTERTRNDQQVHRVLGELIDSLQARSYTLVTAGEMARQSGVDFAIVGEISKKAQKSVELVDR